MVNKIATSLDPHFVCKNLAVIHSLFWIDVHGVLFINSFLYFHIKIISLIYKASKMEVPRNVQKSQVQRQDKFGKD